MTTIHTRQDKEFMEKVSKAFHNLIKRDAMRKSLDRINIRAVNGENTSLNNPLKTNPSDIFIKELNDNFMKDICNSNDIPYFNDFIELSFFRGN